MSIQVLSSEIVNQIAAGEVVERPSHLVKELIENSLDAGADQVTIEAADGGRSIRVQDNGKGILSTELTLALQRHATSKITRADDLWNLSTFGFRGEALASAAAVSRLLLRSCEGAEKKATQIESVFGALSQPKPSSITSGTEIKIEQLFENVPARLKFLKSESSEFSQVKAVVKAMALTRPETEFKLISNGQLQLFYAKKKTLTERAQDVLEKKELYTASGVLNQMNCEVIFSSPQEVAKTSKQIWLFVQGRWVQDRALQAAVMDAYRSLLMHGEYPHAVVHLKCAPEQIDVNIHPTKSQIKFQDASSAFRVVHNTLRNALERAPWLGYKTQPDSQSFNTEFSTVEKNFSFSDHSFQQTQFKSKTLPTEERLTREHLQQLRIEPEEIGQAIISPAPRQGSPSSFDGGYWSSLQVIGQAHLTYIVAQKNDRLVYVDQHAAHERVVYESLMQSWKEKKFEVQHYLFPLALDLSEEKLEVLLKNQSQIEEMGFTVEQLGPESLGVRSAPALLKDSSLPIVFEKMAQELLQHGGSFAIEKKISDLFATMACHSVVRAGQSLSVVEMEELLRSMDRFALSSFCPHGRPVSVETTFNELERLFGRIN